MNEMGVTRSDTERGQVSATAAQVYDAFFVPALFAQWTDVVLNAADVRPEQEVLDVGCGTGVLARAAAARVGEGGHVAAVDPNDGMLAVARHAEAGIGWRTGIAEQLPFPDRSFDRTVSQFALMFFRDQKAALRELGRVTRREGRLSVAVWDRLSNNPGYARLATLIEELFGSDAANAIRAPFQLGDPKVLADIASSGFREPRVSTHHGLARFESLESWLHTEIRGWTLADVIDDEGFASLLDAARDRLADLADGTGVAFDVSALVLSGPPAE